MSLSCSCDYDYEYDAGEWYYNYDNSLYLIPFDKTRRKRCCSCGELIDIGSICNKYPRVRYPHNDVEARINHYGDLETALGGEAMIPMADHYHCERCAEIFLNLEAIGYECISPSEDMRDLLQEYHELSGFKPTPSPEMTGKGDVVEFKRKGSYE